MGNVSLCYRPMELLQQAITVPLSFLLSGTVIAFASNIVEFLKADIIPLLTPTFVLEGGKALLAVLIAAVSKTSAFLERNAESNGNARSRATTGGNVIEPLSLSQLWKDCKDNVQELSGSL